MLGDVWEVCWDQEPAPGSGVMTDLVGNTQDGLYDARDGAGAGG